MTKELEERIGQRQNDAPLETERLLDEAATTLTRYREALEALVPRPKPDETWSALVDPLVSRFTIAAAFDADAVHNGEGARAIAKLMSDMAARLDNAATTARKALEG